MGYYSTIKRNKLLTLAITWMSLKDIVTESQPLKSLYCVVLFIWNTQERQIHGAEGRRFIDSLGLKVEAGMGTREISGWWKYPKTGIWWWLQNAINLWGKKSIHILLRRAFYPEKIFDSSYWTIQTRLKDGNAKGHDCLNGQGPVLCTSLPFLPSIAIF